jgi:YHS domain-containing protein
MNKNEMTISKAMSSLSPEDQKQAKAQRFCPIMEYTRLGADGTPIKVVLNGKSIFVCCKGCVKDAKKSGDATVATTKKLTKVSATLAKLPPDERMAIEAQKYCAVQPKNFLGPMGAPVKLQIEGKTVYVCCNGCKKGAQANPTATLSMVEKLKKAGVNETHDHEDHGKHGDDHDHSKHGDDHGKHGK